MTRKQLLALGWTDATIPRAEADGKLVRLRRGAWVTQLPSNARELHVAAAEAARKAAKDGTVLSHWSAAALWGLPLPDGGAPEIYLTRDGKGGGLVKSDAHLVKAPLNRDEWCLKDGIPVTNLTRTVNDVARMAPFIDGVMVADALLRMKLPPHLLKDANLRARRWPGNAKARRVLDFADGRAESPYESKCRVRLAEIGLSGFVPQCIVTDARGDEIGRIDLALAGIKLGLEYDGEGKYDELAAPGQRPQDVFRCEKERDTNLRQEGWWMQHLTKPDVKDLARFRRVVMAAHAAATRNQQRTSR